jgi:hypothetical protein
VRLKKYKNKKHKQKASLDTPNTISSKHPKNEMLYTCNICNSLSHSNVAFYQHKKNNNENTPKASQTPNSGSVSKTASGKKGIVNETNNKRNFNFLDNNKVYSSSNSNKSTTSGTLNGDFVPLRSSNSTTSHTSTNSNIVNSKKRAIDNTTTCTTTVTTQGASSSSAATLNLIELENSLKKKKRREGSSGASFLSPLKFDHSKLKTVSASSTISTSQAPKPSLGSLQSVFKAKVPN